MVHSLSKTVLMFSNDWSNHCKELHKVILCTDLGDIDYHEVNVLEASDLAKHWGVRGVPTLLLLDENKDELRRHTGLLSPIALQNFVGYDPEPLEDQEDEELELKEPWKET